MKPRELDLLQKAPKQAEMGDPSRYYMKNPIVDAGTWHRTRENLSWSMCKSRRKTLQEKQPSFLAKVVRHLNCSDLMSARYEMYVKRASIGGEEPKRFGINNVGHPDLVWVKVDHFSITAWATYT